MKRKTKLKTHNFKVGDYVTLNALGRRTFSENYNAVNNVTRRKCVENRLRNLLSGVIIEEISQLDCTLHGCNKYAQVSFDGGGVLLCYLKRVNSIKRIKEITKRIVAMKL